MKKALILALAGVALACAGTARAMSCNDVIGLINQGFTPHEIAAQTGIPMSSIQVCRGRQSVPFRNNPAGPPPLNPAGPGPRNPAGPGPQNPAGAPPMNPAGIPR